MTNEDYLKQVTEQLSKIVSNISMTPNDTLLDNGKNIKVEAPKYGIKLVDGLTPKAENEYLLTNWIYVNYYQNRSGIIVSNHEFNQPNFPFDNASDNFKDLYWRNGFWRYDNDEQEIERIVLTRGYETRIIAPQQFAEDELVFEKDGIRIKYLSMVLPKFEIQKDEKFVFGQQPIDDDGQGGIIRFYFNFKSEYLIEAIPKIISLFFKYFNDRLIPFQCKFWSKFENFCRADNLVLYLERRHFFIASIILKHIYSEIEAFLITDRLPYFVRPVLPGIGFAKSPPKEQGSVGVSRSRVIALAIIRQLTRPKKPVIEYLDGIWGGLGNFYLDPKPTFIYTFDIFEKDTTIAEDAGYQDQALKAAFYIAKLLCREAIWLSDSTCNWMSYQVVAKNEAQKDILGYRLLEPNKLFSSIEGVIVFLEAFQKIGIRDSIIEYVVSAARKEFDSKKDEVKSLKEVIKSKANNLEKENDKKVTAENLPRRNKRIDLLPDEVVRNPDDKFDEIIDIITGIREPTMSENSLLQKVLIQYIETGRSLPNRKDGTDNFCVTLDFGLVSYGYAFLRIYAQDKIPTLSEQ